MKKADLSADDMLTEDGLNPLILTVKPALSVRELPFNIPGMFRRTFRAWYRRWVERINSIQS